MTREIHLEARPKTLAEVVGQPEAVAQLKALVKGDSGLPHCILFTGPTGCGKTTLARILKNRLKCGDADFREINAAENRGIEMVRDIQSHLRLAPMSGAVRVYIIDECHQLTADAQGALLKILEEPPDHVYIMMATTHPDKLRSAIRTRATEIAVKSVDVETLTALVIAKAGEFGDGIDEGVAAKIADAADGSARKALVILGQVMGIDSEEAQLKAIAKSDEKIAAIEIARAIMAKKPFGAIAPLIKNAEGEPESIRWMILSYFSSVALNGKDVARCVAVLRCFECNYFDTKKAGLVISVFEACNV